MVPIFVTCLTCKYVHYARFFYIANMSFQSFIGLSAVNLFIIKANVQNVILAMHNFEYNLCGKLIFLLCLRMNILEQMSFVYIFPYAVFCMILLYL